MPCSKWITALEKKGAACSHAFMLKLGGGGAAAGQTAIETLRINRRSSYADLAHHAFCSTKYYICAKVWMLPVSLGTLEGTQHLLCQPPGGAAVRLTSHSQPGAALGRRPVQETLS